MNLEENAPVKTEKFKVLAVILIGVFIFAVGGLGGYWVGSRQQRFSPTALQTSLKPTWLPSAPPVQRLSLTPTVAISQTGPTSDWKTYRNEEYGFEVKYPPGWSIHYEATQKDILETLGSNRKYQLDRPVKIVNWKDVVPGSGYPVIGDISVFLYSEALTEQFIAKQTSSPNIRGVKVRERTINGQSFTDTVVSIGNHNEGPSYSYAKSFYLAIARPDFQTLSLAGFGWDESQKPLAEILEGMVSSLKITK
jgi:hypothetical protein